MVNILTFNSAPVWVLVYKARKENVANSHCMLRWVNVGLVIQITATCCFFRWARDDARQHLVTASGFSPGSKNPRISGLRSDAKSWHLYDANQQGAAQDYVQHDHEKNSSG